MNQNLKEKHLQSFKHVLKENMDTIFRYSLFITGNREKAMDLMQDTIVRLLNKKNVYEEKNAFKTWIFRVLKNNYINTYKKAALHKEIHASDISEDENVVSLIFKDHSSDISNAVDPILKKRILTAFSELPENFRDVCYQIDIEGLNYEETSIELKIPIGTVMSRLHRARAILREKLEIVAREVGIQTRKKA